LVVKKLPDDKMTVDLQSLAVQGHRYLVDAAEYQRPPALGVGIHTPGAASTDDALFGTIVGTVSPGKQGTKTGPLPGAGAAVPTSGRAVNIPAQTVLKFRLNHAMALAHESGSARSR
jgi:hypothetical protein